MCQKLDLGEMRPTTFSLQLPDHYINYLLLRITGQSLQLLDHYIKYHVGVLKDALSKVRDLYAPVNFVICEIGRYAHTNDSWEAFYGTIWCHIDVKNGKLSFDVEMIMWSSICLSF